MKKNRLFIIALAFLFFIPSNTFLHAQSDDEILKELAQEEQEAINALVLYPSDTRKTILEATLHPEALIKMESIQQRTSRSFQELMSGFSQETQQMLWDLTRYPDLIPALVDVSEGSKSAVERVLSDYPQVIHHRAMEAHRNHYSTLLAVDNLQQAAQSAFASVVNKYPQSVQESLNELIGLPEVLTLLTENIRLTILAGDLYERHPKWMLHKADSLNLVVARQNAQELENWKAEMEEDPEAMEEYEASAQAYSEENNYDDKYYDYEYEEDNNEIVVHNYYHYSYPYWFGYPTWYPYPRWRAYPHWYDWGYYYSHGGTILIIRMPSFHFTHWYFHHPHHHIYWPYLSTRFVRHYHHHRGSRGSVSATVARWKEQNKAVVSNSWMKDDGKLKDRFIDFGNFEKARIEYNQKNPKKAVSQKEFALQHIDKYPTQGKIAREYETQKAIQDKVAKKPKAPTRPETRIPAKERLPDENKGDKPSPPKTVPKVKDAKDYHKKSWEEARTKREHIKVQPKPKPNPNPSVKQPPKPQVKQQPKPEAKQKTTINKKTPKTDARKKSDMNKTKKRKDK